MYLSVFDTLLLLRWLGTFALLFTAFNRVVSYSSPNVSIPSWLCLASAWLLGTPSFLSMQPVEL